MVAEGVQVKLQRFAFDQPVARDIVDHDMGKVGLAGHRAERGELGSGKAHHGQAAGMAVGHALQHGLIGAGGQGGGRAQLGQAGGVGLGHGFPRKTLIALHSGSTQALLKVQSQSSVSSVSEWRFERSSFKIGS
jgi:hypothetical protein